ncbi:cAMP-binding proteins - catabolite gene activator and regulatory subunit of cAMP-dependent protein kinases [uncultured Leptolyngbya sp.]|uniref:cAMP-binding proteins - catabolite gene activator and regulatory subunit of cAMP-dependent protein kinases n=1 Tax=uncultured Leptolyngbya sp. TaxID=332963 RepID=A0A6J4PR73_9CYAN|nr:cAMP-binding proteins - catabolite gene activator and regulatory subunit of cAMP-dependent protein kinases [uncultured Leptolyngbya sp.]
MPALQAPPRSSNRLLAALPTDVYQSLQPALELVTLTHLQLLYAVGRPIDHVYFPEAALISLVFQFKDGATMDVGMVGQEGMAGLPVLLGGTSHSHQAMVQVAGKAWRLPAKPLLTEFNRGLALHDLLLRYTQAMLTQTAQNSVCNRFHTTEVRLARWLLLTADGLGADTFRLTHEVISIMLGVRRAGVTVAAGVLSQAGWVRYSRGRITIVDRTGLEAFACECYGVVHAAFAAV